MTDTRPNVLFVVADDHRFSSLGTCGVEPVRTPTLDALAEGGTRFQRAHMMGGLQPAVCVPTRASLMTGMNPFRAAAGHDLQDYANQQTLHPDWQTLPGVFREAGYRTFITGKWHNDKASLQRSFTEGDSIFLGGMHHDPYAAAVHPFDLTGAYPQDAAEPTGVHATERFCTSAARFVTEAAADDQPWFAYMAFTSPHDPRIAPPPFADQYDPDAIELPPNAWPEHPFDNGELTVRDERLAAHPRLPDEVRRHIADYYAMVSHLDAELGRVVAALRDTGQLERTIIVYTSDHGLGVGQHGLLGKQNLYDHSVRVPLIMAGPGVPRGRVVEPIVWSASVYPTLCDVCNLTTPDNVEAPSLVPHFTGSADGAPATMFSLYRDLQRMVSDSQWKLIRYHRGADGRGTEREQLFHLADDPWEINDLIDDPAHRAQRDRLSAELTRWQQRVGDPLLDARTAPPGA
ncbi:MAG: sulfatase-like hydrolase/transferase [Phycisphaeraceae bacterium]